MKTISIRTPLQRILSISACIAGVVLLFAALFFNWADLLLLLRLPSGEFNNPWIIADLTTLRFVTAVMGSLLLTWVVILWKRPQWTERLTRPIQKLGGEPVWIFLILTIALFLKTLLQLMLYARGYAAYGADDFSRSLSADYWLYHRQFDLGWGGWLGMGGSGWLPFSDYLFGFALALNRDLFMTPKIVNLVLSGLAVIVMYWVGRELFGQTAGLLAALLFAFQPWHVWLGMSGMTSDLSSVVLIGLFGMYLVRWLRTAETRPLLIAAAFLGISNGFRYENWLFTIAFSVVIILITASRLIQRHPNRIPLTGAALALVIINAFPVFWMVASYVVMGDWLPALHVTNAFMVGSSPVGASLQGQGLPLVVNQAPTMAQINMAVLAVGSFPWEIALSIAGAVWFFRSTGSRPPVQYLLVLLGTVLLFVIMFKGRLPASIFYARYFLAFVVLALPFAGYFLTQLLNGRAPWRDHATVTAIMILLTLGALDLGRSLNYPDVIPRDGLAAGWIVRELQNANVLPTDAKILIERRQDWGDLAIIALANNPERFVALNEYAYRRLSALPGSLVSLEAAIGPLAHEDVRGSACDRGFEVEACKNSVLRERFSLVIVSSPERIASFEKAFPMNSWKVGRYHIFDMR